MCEIENDQSRHKNKKIRMLILAQPFKTVTRIPDLFWPDPGKTFQNVRIRPNRYFFVLTNSLV